MTGNHLYSYLQHKRFLHEQTITRSAGWAGNLLTLVDQIHRGNSLCAQWSFPFLAFLVS